MNPFAICSDSDDESDGGANDPVHMATITPVTGNDPWGAIRAVASIDPGMDHCAMVRYDVAADAFTHSALINLRCTCPVGAAMLNGPLDVLFGGSSSSSSKKKRKRKVRVPTTFDIPGQLCRMASGRDDVRAVMEGADLVVVERQMTQNTPMMVLMASLQTRYWDRTVQLARPGGFHTFWNEVAAAVGTDPCYRTGMGHSVNKTDTKRLGRRILTPQERRVLEMAATLNARHKSACPSYRSYMDSVKRRRRKKASQKPMEGKRQKEGADELFKPKMDDLMDAAAQAICAVQAHAKIAAEDPRGPAFRRLASELKHPPMHVWQPKKPLRVVKRKRRTGGPLKKRRLARKEGGSTDVIVIS